MASYALNPNGILDSGAELTGVTRQIETAIDDLNTKISNFSAANTGDAATTYQAAQAKWNAGLKEMQESLTRAVGRLNDIHDNYKMGDARGAALFQGHI